MAQSTITDRHRSVLITQVREIAITEVATDGNVHRRALRILGEPQTNGQLTEIFELILETEREKEDIRIDAPPFEF
ncbi:hypothetical protein SAMN06297251_102144 [Fulvimarina manganoxydans]|uniref:Uncharacterized protein n=1 Tax=Fulvimarina manganoxydans TaxID=937218 RepID=A0A1W1Z434_9HYPH|nr:hypothetical protein [Fulvimarina manganoxydans]SMC43205.1 hypothetical protein SAMN06297251_102144 [Fulvimarina manganoxydans]